MTPHNEAKKGEIAKTVLMPGDPMRAKLIAERYLENAKLVNDVRGIYAYTGTYQGKEVTVMASGMGMPSMGIYAYELYHFYDVDTIIRIGTCGSYDPNVSIYSILLAEESYTDSTFAKVQSDIDSTVLSSTQELNQKLIEKAQEKRIPLYPCRIYSTDVFYHDQNVKKADPLTDFGCLATEMESFALFHIASVAHKQATCLLTVSDNIKTGEEISHEERENALLPMIELALSILS